MNDLQTKVQKFLFKWLNDRHLPQGIRPGMAEDLEKFIMDELASQQEQQISQKMHAQNLLDSIFKKE